METLFQFLAKFVDLTINYVILAALLAAIICILLLAKQLEEFRQNLENLLGIRSDGIKITQNLATKQQTTAIIKREDTYEQRKQFNRLCKKYLTLSQLIPLFPLLGILGTVAGLYLQVQTQDASAIYSALSLALSSTFLGLIAAILLKVLETLLLSSRINELDSRFEENELRYNDAIAQKKYSEEQE